MLCEHALGLKPVAARTPAGAKSACRRARPIAMPPHIATFPPFFALQFCQSAGRGLPSSGTMAIHQVLGLIDGEQERTLASPMPTWIAAWLVLATGDRQPLAQGFGCTRNMPAVP